MSSLTPRHRAELEPYVPGTPKRAGPSHCATLASHAGRRALRQEITPKNILMIDRRVGKTEIARRLAKLANAPFVKVRPPKSPSWATSAATSTRSVKDLADVAVKITREQKWPSA